jgi:hypothetical protein
MGNSGRSLLVAALVSAFGCECGPSKEDLAREEAKKAAETAKFMEAERARLAKETEQRDYDELMRRKARDISVTPDLIENEEGRFVSFAIRNDYEKDQDGLGVRCQFFRGTDGELVDVKTYGFMQPFPKGKKVTTTPQETKVRRPYKRASCVVYFAYDKQ